jgi:beta-mannosidase
VYSSFGDLDVRPSDNYFDLLPNEAITISLKSKADLEHLRKALLVRSITDAFLAGSER